MILILQLNLSCPGRGRCLVVWQHCLWRCRRRGRRRWWGRRRRPTSGISHRRGVLLETTIPLPRAWGLLEITLPLPRERGLAGDDTATPTDAGSVRYHNATPRGAGSARDRTETPTGAGLLESTLYTATGKESASDTATGARPLCTALRERDCSDPAPVAVWSNPAHVVTSLRTWHSTWSWPRSRSSVHVHCYGSGVTVHCYGSGSLYAATGAGSLLQPEQWKRISELKYTHCKYHPALYVLVVALLIIN